MAMHLMDTCLLEGKKDAQYFRYENQRRHRSERDDGESSMTLKENLAYVFKDIAEKTLVTPDPTVKSPQIGVQVSLNWDDCLDGTLCGDVHHCGRFECPQYHPREAYFIYGGAEIDEVGDKTVIPFGVMKALVGCIIEGLSQPVSTELRIFNLESKDTIIDCESDSQDQCRVLRVEIETTELEATKEMLNQLQLLPA